MSDAPKTRKRKPHSPFEFVISRSTAASAFDRVRYLLAQGTDPKKIEQIINDEFQIPIPKKCTGEAHSNPHIDNCGACMQFHWGWSGKRLKIT